MAFLRPLGVEDSVFFDLLCPGDLLVGFGDRGIDLGDQVAIAE